MTVLPNRYIRNREMLSEEENIILHKSSAAVIGCGGLGGYIIEMLARLGVGTLFIFDFDTFSEDNLNRQLFCLESTLGQAKVEVAKQRIAEVNSEIRIIAHQMKLDSANAVELLANCQVLVDAVDNIPTRLMLQQVAEELDIPLVHGGIAGWYGQVSTIFPGDRTLNRLYRGDQEKGVETSLGNPSFTPALVASIQVSEVVKCLIKRGQLLRHKVMLIDCLYQDFQVLSLPTKGADPDTGDNRD